MVNKVTITCNNIEANLTKISQDKKREKFRPFIDYIYFPHYKNLAPFTRIDFNFPITVLIGANGTNKSSILRALEACCPNISLGNRWFSTYVDPIRHKPDLPCFVYGYTIKKDSREANAQVLYAKPYRKGDPDYWETGKFTAKYKMTPLPDDKDYIEFWGLQKLRWPKIQKPKPIYLTFRDSISAFDKFYYYGDSNPVKSNIKERRLTIRRYSRTLNNVINKGTKRLVYQKKQRINENIVLSTQALEYVSYILGTKYTEIKLVKHTFYNCEGYTCKFIRNSINYSEAFAGSGEFAVIRIVKEVLDAQSYCLVLLDEPEVSLHPGAQDKLIQFIVEQTLRKKLQVVIATHSPTFIRQLPNESIKVLINDYDNDQTKVLKQSCPPSEAFYHIGEPRQHKHIIIVEDQLAKSLVDYSIESLTPSIRENIEVKFYGGGAFDILNNFGITNALAQNKNIFILLDGDQRTEELPDPETLTESQIINIEEILTRFSGGSLQIPKNSNENIQTILERNKKLLIWFRENVFFLPSNSNPEGFIWERTTSPIKCDVSESIDYKEKFKALTQKLLPTSTEVSSSNILQIQQILLNGIPKEDKDLIYICDQIKSKVSNII